MAAIPRYIALMGPPPVVGSTPLLSPIYEDAELGTGPAPSAPPGVPGEYMQLYRGEQPRNYWDKCLCPIITVATVIMFSGFILLIYYVADYMYSTEHHN